MGVGNSTATSAKRLSSPASSSTLSAGPRRTPSRPACVDQCSGLARSSGHGTITPEASGGAPGSCPQWRQSSRTISRRRSTQRIDALLEGRHPDAAVGVDEALALDAPLPVDLDDALESGGHGMLTHRRPDHLAERGEAVHRTAEGDLIPLLAM